MLEVLSSPLGQVGFTDIEGVQPYYHKYPTPVTKIEYADCVFNTLHSGVHATWSTLNDAGSVSTSFYGSVPCVKFYSGRSIPSTIMHYNEGDDWRVLYHGNFRAPITADYTFYFGGDGNFTFFFDNAIRINAQNINIDSANYKSYGPVSLTEASYKTMYMLYSADRKNTDAGFIGMWQTDSASYTPEKVVMSGEVVRGNCPGSDATAVPTFSNLQSYSKANYQENLDGSQFTFEVPFVSTSSYNYKGYRYKSTTDAFVDIDNGLELKKYRMIRYSEGYRNSNGANEFVTRFTGQIRDFKIKYYNTGEDTLQVTCLDFSVFAKDTINIQSPTPIDYWQAGYLTEVPGRVNGAVKPRCFDGWEVHKAYEVILTECGISPASFKEKKHVSDYSEADTTSGFKIEMLSLYDTDTAAVPWLSSDDNYSIPPIGEVDERADSEYAFPISTGEYYKDALDKIMRTFYYKWGCDNEGHPYLSRMNAPFEYINDRELNNTGTWRNERDVNALMGTYIATTTANCYSSADVTGKKISLLCGCGPLMGSSNPVTTFNVVVRHGATELVDTNYNAFSKINRHYFYGPDPDTGVNPCIIKLLNGVPYDTYRVVVKSSGTYETRIEGILAYDEEYEVPTQTYYTSDKTGDATITQLDIQHSIDDQRTDCVVLGKRTGTIYKTTEEGEEVTFNRNNPVHTYIMSASRDLRSVYNSTAVNYVGRPRTTLIIDPAVVSQEQADYISYSVVNEYNEPSKEVSFEMQGNPVIKVNDCIAVVEDFKQGVTSDDYLWVTEVNNTFDKSYTTKIKTTPHKPVDSYWERPLINVDEEYDGHYIWNLKVKYAGYTNLLTDHIFSMDSGASYNTKIAKDLSTEVLSYMIPKAGYFRVGKEIMKYASADVSDSYVRLKGLTRRIQQVDTSAFLEHRTGDQAIIGNMPYSRSNWPTTVDFDLLVPSKVKVEIRNYDAQDLETEEINTTGEMTVDVLTNIEEDIITGDNFQSLKPGHYTFSWGGFDRIGAYNNAVKDPDSPSMLGADFFALENYGSLYSWVEIETTQEAHIPRIVESVFDTAYGMFYPLISISAKEKGLMKNYDTINNDTYLYATSYGTYDRSGVIKQILIDPGIIDLKFATAGLYVSTITGSENFANEHNHSYVKTNRKSGTIPVADLIQAEDYPYIIPSGRTRYRPVFVLNKSNPNTLLIPQGLKFNIIDYSEVNDTDIDRFFLPTLKFKFCQFGFIEKYTSDINTRRKDFLWFDHEIHDGVLNEDVNIKKITPGDEYYFNINRWAANKEIEYVPSKWKSSLKKYIKEKASNENYSLYVNNVLYFGHTLRDLSGRQPKQMRYYKQIITPGTEFRLANNIAAYLDPNIRAYNYCSQYTTQELQQDLMSINPTLTFGFFNRDEDFFSITHKNRGFYEFFEDKPDDNWTWWQEGTGKRGNFSYYKNLYDEVYLGGGNEEQSSDNSKQIFRTNYITWCNEDLVKEIRWMDFDFPNIGRGSNFLESARHKGYDFSVFIPNIWFVWREGDL